MKNQSQNLAATTFRVPEPTMTRNRRTKTLMDFLDPPEKHPPITNLPIPIEDNLPIDPMLLTGYR